MESNNPLKPSQEDSHKLSTNNGVCSIMGIIKCFKHSKTRKVTILVVYVVR